MSKKRKSSASVQKTGDGFIGRLFAQTKLPAHVTEEQDWYLDTPDVRLTRVFTIVLILHVVAVGGILAFKMVEKASNSASVAIMESDAKTEAGKPATPVEPAPPAPAAAPASKKPATADSKATSLLVDHPSATEYQEYRVGSGESLISIAKKLGVSASMIREINHLDSGSNLTVGRWIRVPKGSATPHSALAAVEPAPEKPAPAIEKPAPAVAKPAPAPKPAAIAAPKPAAAPTAKDLTSRTLASYEVQKGDTLFGIARRFGIKYQDLMAANQIDRPENLQAGQTLQVPKK